MADPFAFADPFDAGFGADPFGPRGRRRAAFPATPEPEARSAIAALTDGTLSGLGYVGSLLDKLTGARAIRGTLGGHPRELLSLVPFSDSLGITDPSEITSGEKLLEDAGLIAANDPDRWEVRDFLGPAAELALDPATYLGGVGALTKAGVLARKAGTPTKGLVPAVAAGERTIHPLLALAPKEFQAAVGALPGKVLGGLNVGVRKVPGLAAAEDYAGRALGAAKVALRAKFDPRAGFVPEATVQAAHEATYLPTRESLLEPARGRFFDESRALAPPIEAGVDPGHLDRYLRQRVEGVEPGWIGRSLGPHLPAIDPVADRIRAAFAALPPEELALGLKSPLLSSTFDLGYATRQALKAPGADPGGRLEKLFGTANASQKRRLAAFDLPGGTAQVGDVIRDPGFSALARTKAGKDLVRAKVWDLLTEGLGMEGVGPSGYPIHPDLLPRMQKTRRLLPEVLAKVPDAFIDLPGRAAPTLPFFKADLLQDLLLRETRSAHARAAASAVYDVIGRGHVPSGAPGTTPVATALRRAGLRGEASREHALRAVGIDPADVLADAQAASPDAPIDAMKAYRAALAPFALPDPAARGATKLLTRFAAPEETTPALRALDSSLALSRNLLYTIFPSSHVRNVASGLAENAVEAGMAPWDRAYVDAGRALHGEGIVTGLPGHAALSPDDQRLAFLRELYVKGLVDPLRPQGELNQVAGVRVPVLGNADPARARTGAPDVLKGWLDVKGALKDPLGMQGVSGSLKDPLDLGRLGPRLADTNPMVKAGKAAGRTSEDWLRSAEYLSLRRQGYAPDAARPAVLRTHLDYVGGLSDFERNVMRRLVPFYTFSRLNVPKQVGRAIERPATVQAPLRLAGGLRDESSYTPEYLASGLAVPLGRGEDGTARFLTQLGLPFEEAFGHLRVGTTAGDTLARTGMNLAASLRGEVKAPLEALAGRQFFTGRELKDLRPGNLASGFGLFDEDTSRLVAQALANTPPTRLLSTAEKLLDARKWADPYALPLALLTGAKVTDVDTEKWRAIDARRRVEQLLDAMPHVAESRDFYARPEDRALVTAEERDLLELQAYIKARAREAAAARRVGVAPAP